jgi:hypothetical protein
VRVLARHTLGMILWPETIYRRKQIVDAARWLISDRSAPIPLSHYGSPRSICELAPARGLAIAVRLVLLSAAAASTVSATASPIA